MKALPIVLLCAVIGVVCSVLGSKRESDRIQQSCESDYGSTVINGTPYLCLSQRHLEFLKQQAQSGSNSA